MTTYFEVHLTFSLSGGISRKDENNFEAEETEKFDSEAMQYLSYILIPLLILGAVYSLLYTPHKSWTSWTIQSLVNGVYAFGFLFMLPQLFVNYRLKVRLQLNGRLVFVKYSALKEANTLLLTLKEERTTRTSIASLYCLFFVVCGSSALACFYVQSVQYLY